MAVIIQRPNTPEERFWEETEWMEVGTKDQLVASWGEEDALMAKEDSLGVVRLRQRRVAEDPENLHAIEDLAQAYLMAGDGSAAVQLLTPIHARYPARESTQRWILEALFQQDYTEQDFAWQQRIPVLRLGPKVVDLCHQLVTDAEGLMIMGDLYEDLTYHGYLAFGWQELGRFLRRLGDFEVRGAQRQIWRLWVELPDVSEGRQPPARDVSEGRQPPARESLLVSVMIPIPTL